LISENVTEDEVPTRQIPERQGVGQRLSRIVRFGTGGICTDMHFLTSSEPWLVPASLFFDVPNQAGGKCSKPMVGFAMGPVAD
jgi:hypothetical protein